MWLIRLQEAGGDLATSYLQEAATLNDRRRAGVEKRRVETATYVVDRQKALGRFRTLPRSGEFEEYRLAMGRAIELLWREWDDPDEEFQLAYDRAREAASQFMTAIGAHVLRRGAHQLAATEARRHAENTASWCLPEASTTARSGEEARVSRTGGGQDDGWPLTAVISGGYAGRGS